MPASSSMNTLPFNGKGWPVDCKVGLATAAASRALGAAPIEDEELAASVPPSMSAMVDDNDVSKLRLARYPTMHS